jgi:Uncharacterized alpha/beta hydrolase domain (DUF2235)
MRGHFPNATRQRLREDRDESGCASERSQGDFNGHRRKLNIVFYERGVGTGAFLDRYLGGAFGQGLSTNIRRTYKFLSSHCEPGRSRRQRRRASSRGCRLWTGPRLRGRVNIRRWCNRRKRCCYRTGRHRRFIGWRFDTIRKSYDEIVAIGQCHLAYRLHAFLNQAWS